MASERIDIQINALVNGVNQIKEIVSGLRDTGAGSGATASQLDALAKASQEVSNKLSGLTSRVKQLVTAYLGFLAIGGAKEMADMAARTETLGVTLDVVSDTAGYSEKAIQGFEKELKKLGITTQVAREAMIKMIQAGIPLEQQAGKSASNIALLARASQDLAVVTGQNSSETFSRLVTNIQQLDTMGLRFMGLTIDIQIAQERYAASIGKSVGSLSQQQKQMAVNNAVLEEAAKLQGSYEQALGTVGKKVQSLQRYQDELADAMGKHLLPAYGAIVDAATNLLKHLTDVSEGFDKSKRISSGLAATFEAVASAISTVISFFADLMASNEGSVAAFANGLASITQAIGSLIESLFTSELTITLFGGALKMVAMLFANFADGIAIVTAGIHFLRAGFAFLSAGLFTMMADLASSIPFLGKYEAGLRDIADEAFRSSEAAAEAGMVIVNNFAAGNSETQRLHKNIEGVRVSLESFGKSIDFKTLTAEFDLLDKNIGLLGDNATKAKIKLSDSMSSLAEGGKLSAEELQKIADRAKELGIEVPAEFLRVNKVVKQLEENTFDLTGYMKKLGEATAFEELQEAFKNLIQITARGTVSAYELGQAYELAEKKWEEFKKSGDTGESDKLLQYLKLVKDAATKDLGDALTILKLTTGEIQTHVSAKMKEVADAVLKATTTMGTNWQLFSASFGKGLDTAKTIADLNSLFPVLAAVQVQIKALQDAGKQEKAGQWIEALNGALDLTKIKFQEAFNVDLKGAKTWQDVQIISQGLENAVKGGIITWDEFGQKLILVSAAFRKFKQEVDDSDIAEPLKKIGITAEEMRGQASLAVKGVIEGLNELLATSVVTSEEFHRVWSQGLNTAKTLEDIGALRIALGESLIAGKITVEEFNKSLGETDNKFLTIVKSMAGMANTKAEFDDLKKRTTALGLAFGKSSEVIKLALAQIDKAASNMTGSLLRNSEALLTIAQKETAVITAQITKGKQLRDIKDQQKRVSIAETQALEDGTEASQARAVAERAVLKAMQDKEKVAEQEVVLAQAQIALQQLNNELVAAQAALALDGSTANQQIVLDLQEEIDKRQTIINLILLQLELEQQTSADSADTADKAGEVAGALENAADAAGEMAEQVEKNVGALNWMKQTLEGIYDSIGEVSGEAAASVKAVIESYGSWYDKMAQIRDLSASDFVGSNQVSEGSKQVALLTEKYKSLQSEIGALKNSGGAFDYFGPFKDMMVTMREFEAELVKAQMHEIQVQEKAEDIVSTYYQVADAAEDAANGMGKWSNAADAISQAYKEIALAAKSAVDSAKDAADSLTDAASSIYVELLNAQGKEEEATRITYANRKKDLALQYEQLKVEVQIARVKATAAGVSTAELDVALSAATTAYAQAMAGLGELEKMKLADIATTKREEKAAEKAAAAEKRAEEAAARQEEEEAVPPVDQSVNLSALEPAKTATLEKDLAEVVRGAQTTVPTTVITRGAYGTASQLKDLGKIIIEVGDQTTEVMTADPLALITTLQNIKKVSVARG